MWSKKGFRIQEAKGSKQNPFVIAGQRVPFLAKEGVGGGRIFQKTPYGPLSKGGHSPHPCPLPESIRDEGGIPSSATNGDYLEFEVSHTGQKTLPLQPSAFIGG